MKYIIILTMLLSTTAYANENAETKCKNYYDYAFSTMKARQGNVPMHKLFDLTGGNKTMQKMIIDAYEIPLFSTKQIKEKTINEFANDWYLWCVKRS